MKRLIATALACVLLMPVQTSADIRPDYEAELTPYIEEVCEEYGVSAELVEAMIETESSWNPKAQTEAGARGLMQIVGKYQTERMERLGITDLMDPEQNILCGVDMIAEYEAEGFEVYEMLVAYRYGEYSNTYKSWNGESISYADKVLERARELEIEHGK